jgi:hypothetical protein
LVIAAAARALLQVSAMPPYAGLDEIHHVAHLVFAAQEKRSPTTREASVAPYLRDSIHQVYGSLPSFAHVAGRWPQVVRENSGAIIQERVLEAKDLRPYQEPTYEAQQTRLYYALSAPLLRLIQIRTAEAELRLWRLVSVALAVIIVVATAVAGEAMFGLAGIPAAAVLLAMPTWFALVLRVANDPLACAFVACGFAVSAIGPRRVIGSVLEGLLWAAAAATKLYTWPLFVVLPLLWWPQRAARSRVVIVCALSAIGAAWALLDLRARTSNPLGIVAFDRPGTAALDADVDWGEIIRVTIASAAWTAGQHWNALTPLAIAIYLGPIAVLIGLWLVSVLLPAARGEGARRADEGSFTRPLTRPSATLSPHGGERGNKRRLPLVVLLPAARGEGARRADEGGAALTLPLAALAAFGVAQLFNVWSCVLARRAGNPVTIGGKEGWYWYVAAPIVVATLLPPILRARPKIFIAALCWLVAWDIVIHEVALFHDYAGTTSPESPTALFRWGPLLPPFTAHLRGIAVGPGERLLIAWRAISLIAIAAAFVLYLRHSARRADGTT